MAGTEAAEVGGARLPRASRPVKAGDTGEEPGWREGGNGTDVRRRLQLKGRARAQGLEEHAEGPGKSLRAGEEW